MCFDGRADLEHLGGGSWRTLHELTYTTTWGETITVPEGFYTDLATIPRLIWPILAPFEIARPAIIHDYLYGQYDQYLYKRKRADRVLFDAMGAIGLTDWRRYGVYYAVRIFGGIYAKR